MKEAVEYRSAASSDGSARLDAVVSAAALLLLAVTAIGFAWCVPYHRGKTLEIFKDFGMSLPASTRVVVSIPTWTIIAFAAAVVVVALVVQVKSRSKRSAALFHLLMTVMLGVLFLAYREAMGSAMTALIQAIR